jgi:hypothetical protein
LPELLNIPSNCLLAFANLLKLVKVQAGESIISYDEKEPDPYIIADGFYYLNVKAQPVQSKVKR